jgi:hypothetical protein
LTLAAKQTIYRPLLFDGARVLVPLISVDDNALDPAS